MGRITVFNHVTLDGVMQAPARPDEDRRGGFSHGGWAASRMDAAGAAVARESMATTGGILFGRRTYEDFYSVWPNRSDNPYTEVLNNTQKYVASTTLAEPLPWKNSTLLHGDVADAVARLKKNQTKDLVILGSGQLIDSLMKSRLIDQFILLIHPLVLGAGRRLFNDGALQTDLQLVDAKTSANGVVLAIYTVAG